MISHQPCPCGKSSDAYTIYSDHGFCFSCSKRFQGEEEKVEGTFEYLPWRGIPVEVMRKNSVRTKIDLEGRPREIGFPFGSGHIIRNLDEKKFYSLGEMSGRNLGGTDVFPAGCARAVTVCEGALDSLSAQTILGPAAPVVYVRSAGSTKLTKEEIEYLNSFEKIYLCLDNDPPGQAGVRALARHFDFNKVYHVRLGRKDVNEYLEANEGEIFKKIWWNSGRFLPEGVVSTYREFEEILRKAVNKEGVPLPFPTLQGMVRGLRTGESYLLTALEGIGKTEIVRAIEYSVLKQTDSNIAVIHLEESKDRALKGLIGYELSSPIHLPEYSISSDEQIRVLKGITRRDERLHVYSHFDSDDPDVLLDTIRFLVTSCDCKYVFFDHITMAVTLMKSDDERRTLDYLSTRLEMMVNELDFCLVFVSHVNDDGLTRGSRNISKVANTWVHISRDIANSSEVIRNTSYLTVRKNRFGAKTGPAGRLFFNEGTFVVSEISEELPA